MKWATFKQLFQTLASAVVQVFLADPPGLNRWNKRCCGVATFIKDNQKRSYFIRVYNIKVGCTLGCCPPNKENCKTKVVFQKKLIFFPFGSNAFSRTEHHLILVGRQTEMKISSQQASKRVLTFLLLDIAAFQLLSSLVSSDNFVKFIQMIKGFIQMIKGISTGYVHIAGSVLALGTGTLQPVQVPNSEAVFSHVWHWCE